MIKKESYFIQLDSHDNIKIIFRIESAWLLKLRKIKIPRLIFLSVPFFQKLFSTSEESSKTDFFLHIFQFLI